MSGLYHFITKLEFPLTNVRDNGCLGSVASIDVFCGISFVNRYY